MRPLLFILFVILLFAEITAQVGINNPNPHASAALDVTSTTKGFLPPRLSTEQRDAISSLTPGLIIYNTTTNCLNFYTGSNWHEVCGDVIVPPGYPDGFVHCVPGNPTFIADVINPTTGKVWMDRNMGASQVALSSSDANSFGDLYQWGRFADGHHCRTSNTTTILSESNSPGHGLFILPPLTPYDWRSPQNDNLWQGASGTNNPCPSEYRLPTHAELESERTSWLSNNAAGAFGSPLKLPLAGYRLYTNGTIDGNLVGYWSSTVSSTFSYYLHIVSGNSFMQASNRALGFSVRCIKN